MQTLNGHLVVYVPLREGGELLSRVTRGLSDPEGANLKIVIPTWLAEELSLAAGCDVSLSNRDGQFNIQRVLDAPDR